jgi:hypothetical protein
MKFHKYPVEFIKVIKEDENKKRYLEWEPNPDVTKSTNYEAFRNALKGGNFSKFSQEFS